jgi:hypothetical protein
VNDIIRNPKTVKALADEIIKVCDDYWARHEGKKLFKGKERIELVNRWLESTQTEL